MKSWAIMVFQKEFRWFCWTMNCGGEIPSNLHYSICWQHFSQRGRRKITIVVRILELQRLLPTSAPREEQLAIGSMYLVFS